MQKSVCIIDFSAPEIRAAVLTEGEFEVVDLNLPWEVGFRQEVDGTLITCFGEAFNKLDSNRDTEIQFTDLELYFKEITDAKILEHIFDAFLTEIFHQRLPEHGYLAEAMSVYVITPYQWKSGHRQQLRKTLKHIETNPQEAGFAPPNVMLRSLFSQVLCLSVYYGKTWNDQLAKAGKLHLFLIDFERHDLTLYQLVCEEFTDYVKVELCDILRFPDYFMDIEKQVSDLRHTLEKVNETVSIMVGFSGTIDYEGRAIIELLKARCNAIFLEPEDTAALLGAAELVQQFETKELTKPLHLNYRFCFGALLPDSQWVELLPKECEPPCQRKKAFRVTGTLEKFDLHLFCGLSLTDCSDVHYLATLEIDPTENSNFSFHNSREFILSVTLNNSTHGTFAAHPPDDQKPISVEFIVPVLAD